MKVKVVEKRMQRDATEGGKLNASCPHKRLLTSVRSKTINNSASSAFMQQKYIKVAATCKDTTGWRESGGLFLVQGIFFLQKQKAVLFERKSSSRTGRRVVFRLRSRSIKLKIDIYASLISVLTALVG